MPEINDIGRTGSKRKSIPMPMTQRRAILEYLKGVYNRNVIVTESYLRSTIQAQNIPTQQLKFGFQNSAPVNPFISTDNGLAQSDTFEVTHMMLTLFTCAAAVAGGLVPAAANFASIAQRQFFPNKNIFNGVAAGSIEWMNLLGIYNANLTIKIDTTVYYESFSMAPFLKVGFAEAGVAVSAVATTGVIPFSSGDSNHCSVEVVPMFMINGSGKQDIHIDLADACLLGATDAASPTRINYIEFTMLGFLCQGGAGQKVNKA